MNIQAPTPETQAPAAQTEEAKVDPVAAAVLGADAPKTDEPKKEEPKKEDSLSSRFSALAKKEKSIQRQLNELKALQTQLAEKEAKVKEFDSIEDPLELLKRKGYSYEDLTNRVLNNGKPTPEQEVQSVKQQLEAFKKSQEDQRRKDAEDAKAQAERGREEAISEFKEQITDFVAQNTDAYELTHLHGVEHLIFDTIQKHWDAEQERYSENPEGPKPKVMSMKEAADLVEKYMEEQVEKTLKAKKIASRFAPAKEEPKAPASPGSPTKTLANVPVSSAPSMLPSKTENDRLARALAALSK